MSFFFLDSLSTLSPGLFQSSRCQSPALPSSLRVSYCPLYGLCPVPGQNALGHPGSGGLACLHPTGGEKHCYCHVDSCFHISQWFSALLHVLKTINKSENWQTNTLSLMECAIPALRAHTELFFPSPRSSFQCSVASYSPTSVQKVTSMVGDTFRRKEQIKDHSNFLCLFDNIMNLTHDNEICRH